MKNSVKPFIFLIILMGFGSLYAAQPEPWQINFQESASPLMDKLTDFHNLLIYIISAITIAVLILLIYVIIKFNRKANPVPSKVSHNTLLEVVWTAIPVIILLFILVPSMRVLYYSDEVPESEMTLKVIGYQWYWGYQYPDHDNISFDSYMKEDKDLKGNEPRLLAVDNQVVLPVDTVVKILVTGADVIHGFALPAFGIKIDAIPGRLNETWVKIKEPGTYYGQCSELCGVKHGFMPIAIKAVSKEEFKQWVKEAKKKYAENNSLELVSIINK